MIIIGERINGTRKPIREAIQNRDGAYIMSEITRQDRAGADYIDLNAGTGSGSTRQEQEDMNWLIDCALESSEKMICLDSANAEVLESAAAHLAGRRSWMLNSIKGGESEVMDSRLTLAADTESPVIALAMDNEGIPRNSEKRLHICLRIAEKAIEAGVKEDALFFDSIVMPVSTDITQGRVTLQTLAGIKRLLPKAKTTMGLSNISHGFQKRGVINSAFLNMAIGYGLDSAICDITETGIKKAILLADMLAGKDRHCRKFTRALRQGTFD